MATSIGNVNHGKLYAFQMIDGQERKADCQFEQRENGSMGIKTLSYDKNEALFIDPLVYSTFIGGAGHDVAKSLAVDNNGTVYVIGRTFSSNYPTTSAAYDQSHNGASDAFITIMNANLSELAYSTFLGGALDDEANSISISIDNNSNVYIAGYTVSTNFPATINAYDRGYNGGDADIFAAQLHIETLTYPVITIQDVWWENIIDNDGDGYARSARLVWEPMVSGVEQTNAYHKIYAKSTAQSSWWDTNLTLDQTLTPVGPIRTALVTSASVQVISGRTIIDLKIRMGLNFMSDMMPFWEFLPSDFDALNDVKFERPEQDGGAAGPTRLQLSSPNGGETWYVGDTYPITWAADQYIGTIKFQITTDNEATWQEIVPKTANDGSEQYTPTFAAPQCLIRVVLIENPNVHDKSDAPFAIRDNGQPGFWADVDNDEDVDVIDIQIMASRWNTRQGDPRYDPKYDVDNDGAGDGDIDIIDIQLVAAWWNKPITQ